MAQQIGQLIKQSSFATSQMESQGQTPCRIGNQTALAIRKDDECYLSPYSDRKANPQEVAVCLAKLKYVFPRNGDGFFNVLAERVTAKRMSVRQLNDAVNHVIDHNQYGELRVSDIVGFDQRIKLYGYNEATSLIGKEIESTADLKRIEIGGKNYWAKRSDLARYGLE